MTVTNGEKFFIDYVECIYHRPMSHGLSGLVLILTKKGLVDSLLVTMG